MADVLRPYLLQVFFFLMVALTFLALVARSTDPNLFFLRFYTKDVGLAVEALHAVDGEVTLTYTGFHPDHHFTINLTPQELFLGRQKNEVRQQFGATPALPVHPIVLNASSALFFTRTEREIWLNKTPGVLTPGCGASHLFLKKRLRLVLKTEQGLDGVREKLLQFPLVQELLHHRVDPRTAVTLTLSFKKGALGVTYPPGAFQEERLACLLARELEAPEAAGDSLTITLRERDEATVVGAVARVLDEAIE